MPTDIVLDNVKVLSADVLMSVGARPSRIVIEGDTTTEPNGGPHALYISEDSTTLVFTGLRLISTASRPTRWGSLLSTQYVLEDKRNLWWEKVASYQCNKLKLNGTRVNEKNLQDVFDDLLTLAGETTHSTANASSALYPVLDYKTPVPVGKMLEDLCEMTHHAICPQDDGSFDVYKLGSGTIIGDLPRKAFKQSTERAVKTHKAVSAPAVYQSLISLVPRAIESNGTLVSLASASYIPGSGWGGEWPGNFSGVSVGSQHLAQKSIYRVFIPGAVDNDQATGGMSLSGMSAEVFDTGAAAIYDDGSGIVVDNVIGEFWPEYHRGDVTTGSTARYHGDVEVKDGVYHFGRPVFQVDDGVVSPPSLQAMSWHRATDADGKYVARTTGSGYEVPVSWVVPVLRHTIGNNLADVDAQLGEMAGIYNTEANVDTFMSLYKGPVGLSTNGNMRIIRYRAGYAASSGFVETEVYVGDGWKGIVL